MFRCHYYYYCFIFIFIYFNTCSHTVNKVVRRYAEFLASLLVINHYEVEAHMTPDPQGSRVTPPSPSPTRVPQSPKGDQRVDAWLTVLRTTIEKLLDTIAYHLDPRPRPVFLINNYDLIISVLRVLRLIPSKKLRFNRILMLFYRSKVWILINMVMMEQGLDII